MVANIGSPERKEKRSSETQRQISQYLIMGNNTGNLGVSFFICHGSLYYSKAGMLGHDQYVVILLQRARLY